MSKSKTKKWLPVFDEIKDLGAGGNADVYLVTEKASGHQYALKELRNRNEEKKSRFISEIQIAKENAAMIPGIIPVVADDCENYWYTMPIAQPVMDFINKKNLDEIVNGVLQLCETLEQLHDRGIHHRDIKPSNIYYYEGRFSLGDFGLVDFPDNDDFTRSDQGLGAIFTIAPEMKRNPKVADASKADVFSLAKTLWMFLSGDEGFSEDYRWSYFRLDLKKLTPIICKHEKIDYEYLVEDVPGHYVDASYVQYGVYDYDSGKALPKGYKEVRRYLEGSFLFVLKNGPYNHITGTYDGRHGLFESDDFRDYIEKLIKMYLALYERASCDEQFKELSREEIDRTILNIPYFNDNPFRTDEIDEEEKHNSDEKRGLIKKKRAFILENYKEWNFLDAFCPNKEYTERPICFFFEFNESSSGNIFNLINKKKKCICRDGFIKEVTDRNFEECAFVKNREEAIEILDNIMKIFETYLDNEGLAVDDYHQYFSISFRRYGIPTHLFEKSEIETAMRNADDRHNNQLVVDEDGYVKIISGKEDGMLYPVRLEGWDAGNNYVGKYSQLNTIDDNYQYCLYGWLQYLKTGGKQYMDYLTENIEEEILISQIKELYDGTVIQDI